jgi:hypothetical protein
MRLDSVRMVRPMISRVCAAVIVVGFSFASLLAASQSFARGGGFGGRSIGWSGGFHPPVLRRSVVGSSFRAPIHDFARGTSPQEHERHLGFGVPLRREVGFGVPLIVPGGSFMYGSYYDPSDNYVPNDQPNYAEPEIVTGTIPRVLVGPAAVFRPGCRTETVMVPSENGGDRTINIVRC